MAKNINETIDVAEYPVEYVEELEGQSARLTVDDKYCRPLNYRDKVSLFGKIGIVECFNGAYGIYFKEGIDWDFIEGKMPKDNIPHFCYHDTFISFWELTCNFNCYAENLCEVVEKIS